MLKNAEINSVRMVRDTLRKESEGIMWQGVLTILCLGFGYWCID